MDKKFIRVEDQDVSVYKVYADASGNACSDTDAAVQMTTSELQHVFYVGCVIVANGVEYAPVSLSIASGVATISYVTAGDSTVTLATVVSKADA